MLSISPFDTFPYLIKLIDIFWALYRCGAFSWRIIELNLEGCFNLISWKMKIVVVPCHDYLLGLTIMSVTMALDVRSQTVDKELRINYL
jgi:hypothetical protein